MTDIIDHPYHYNTGDIEVIDAIEDWKLDWCLGNAIKYVARAPHKGNYLEDLKKAVWYLQRAIRLRCKGDRENEVKRARKSGILKDNPLFAEKFIDRD